jgi:hypothetical protein
MMKQMMMMGALILSVASPALADDDYVTPRARAAVLAALKRAGCTSPAQRWIGPAAVTASTT